MPASQGRAPGRLLRQLDGGHRHRAGVHPRPGGAQPTGHHRHPGVERRECLCQRRHRRAPGLAGRGSGLHDVVLVIGVEKLFHENREVSFRALASANDVELAAGQEGKSSFLQESSRRLARYMETSGGTLEHVAKVAAKSRRHASLNPLAQFRDTYTVEQILASPVVAPPLTRLMCSPITDGAAALVICSEAFMPR